ncbi:MAG: 50S ribosomal protein L11 methyltransferase [Muribaculaceae bacterium]|nr:50S ribosomal protein L11 methyltransferase [Muribaculaceae bacterium]
MNDYISLNLIITPLSSDSADLMAAYLADVGYESFVETPEGLTAYIPVKNFNQEDVKTIIAQFPIPVEIKYSFKVEEGKDWNEEWEKNYFKPILIDNTCVIHSSFHNDFEKAEYEIVIDPKMAFGTGHHATTTMMVSELLKLNLEGKTVTDMGTGTGILAILASMRGAREVNAIEIDPFAVINARENVQLNIESGNAHCDSIEVNVFEGNAETLMKLPKADVFLANINRNVILADLPLYVDAMKPGALLQLSGFYEKDIPLIEQSASLYGLSVKSIRTYEGDWACLTLTLNA